jgi:hypothetical protein
LKNFITLSGRRWNPHGSSKEGSGKEAGSKKASQEGGSKEEIIFTLPQHVFCKYLPYDFSHIQEISDFTKKDLDF